MVSEAQRAPVVEWMERTLAALLLYRDEVARACGL